MDALRDSLKQGGNAGEARAGPQGGGQSASLQPRKPAKSRAGSK